MKIKELINMLKPILRGELIAAIFLAPLFMTFTKETIEKIKRNTGGMLLFIIVHIVLYRNSSYALYNI